MRAAMRQELAQLGQNPFWPATNGVLRSHDTTLLRYGGAQGIWAYDLLEMDDAVHANLQKRKLAVVGRPWNVEAASEETKDQAAAEAIEKILHALPFDRICGNLLDAILKGFAVAEVVWEARDRLIIPQKILSRDQRRFHFDLESQPLLATWENIYPGIAVPERKFIVHRYGAKDENPYGLGLGAQLYWPVWFKEHVNEFWSTFLDRFGNPGLVAKYPAGTDPAQQRELLEALKNWGQETAISVPDSMLIELIEAGKGGGADSYFQFCTYQDNRISRIVLGETDVSGKQSGGAIAAAAIIRNEVRLELVQADASLLADTLNNTLIAWLCDFNFPNVTPPRIKWDVTLPEDLKTKAQRDLILTQMGYEPDLEYINRTYDGAWRKRAAPTPQMAVGEPPKPGMETGGNPQIEGLPNDTGVSVAEMLPSLYAEAGTEAVIRDAARLEALIPDAAALQAASEAMFEPILARLQTGATPAEILGWLAETWPQMDFGVLEGMLDQAALSALRLGGRNHG
ncbi:MAG: DUF935 family protein [Magnetococcales bacterium]|nr:DUF935 family protein [Magnetococcales bacterium]